MTGTELHLSSGWTAEPVEVEIDLADVMFDLEPTWQDWTPPVAVAS